MDDKGTQDALREMLSFLFLKPEERMKYSDFLQSKQHKVMPVGFDIGEEELHPSLFDFQRLLD